MKAPSIIRKFWGSFDNNTGGYSARKLSACFAINIAALITVWKVPTPDQIYAACAWLVFALLCLGIITAEQIIKFKNGGDKKDSQSLPQDEASASHI
jgi:hypothetical protein